MFDKEVPRKKSAGGCDQFRKAVKRGKMTSRAELVGSVSLILRGGVPGPGNHKKGGDLYHSA